MGKLKLKGKADDLEASPTDAVDRIVLKRDERDRLDGWLQAFAAKYDGMIKISKSDLANFLIRQHDETLSDLEMKLLGAELYDELRWINRAIEKVREAKRAGSDLSLEDVMAKRKPLEKMRASLKKRSNKTRNQSANNESYIGNQVDDNADKPAES